MEEAMGQCKYRMIDSVGVAPDQQSTLTPHEGPQNTYCAALSFGAGASALSQQITTRVVEIQSDAPYRIRFGSANGEDPADPTSNEFDYPVDTAPRMVAVNRGCKFKIIGV
jgi:hypothetical protein